MLFNENIFITMVHGSSFIIKSEFKSWSQIYLYSFSRTNANFPKNRNVHNFLKDLTQWEENVFYAVTDF